MTARLYLWCFDHPALRRPLCAAGVACRRWRCCGVRGPAGGAADQLEVLDWTGLRDTYGVPIGDYYLALASVPEQIAAGAPDRRTWNPTPGRVDASRVAMVSGELPSANILTAEAGLFVGVVAMALWLLKVTVSPPTG